MNSTEYLKWAKQRANEYLDQGETILAWTSFCNDLNEHDELRNHIAIPMGMALVITGRLSTEKEMRKFINDFN